MPFDSVMQPIAAKRSHVHEECTRAANAGRAWCRRKFEDVKFTTSQTLVTAGLASKSVWMNEDDCLDVEFSRWKAWQGSEGVRLCNSRLMDLLPSKEILENGGTCIQTAAHFALPLIVVLGTNYLSAC